MAVTRTIPVAVPEHAWQPEPPALDGTPRPRYAVWQVEVPDGDEWRPLNAGQLHEGSTDAVVARFADDAQRARVRWIKGGGTLAVVDVTLDGAAAAGGSTYGGR